MKREFLPIGTVVMLKDASKRLMITGFCAVDINDKSQFYDYCGCLYPEGVIKSDQNAVFNHDQIEKIYYIGCRDEEEVEFKKKLNQTLSTVRTESNPMQSSVNPGFIVNNQNSGFDV